MTSQILRKAFDLIKQDTGAEYLFGTFYGSAEHVCCNSCASASLASNGHDTGFFFHEQSAERVGDTDKLGIGYFAPTREAKTNLGAKISWHLLEQGFTVEWNGDPDYTIFVGGFTDWDAYPWTLDDDDWDDDDWEDDEYYDDEDYLEADPDF